MDAKHRGIHIFGWVAVIASYCFALLLLRGAFIGITRGFGGNPGIFWLIAGYLLSLAFATYLFIIGRRVISVAKGDPPQKMRFGWGRILLGVVVLYSAAADRFHVFPARIKKLEYSNQMQATAGEITAIVIYIGFLLLIVWGIWKGFRREKIKPELNS